MLRLTLTPNVTCTPFCRRNGSIVDAGTLGLVPRVEVWGMVWRSGGVTVLRPGLFDVFGWRL